MIPGLVDGTIKVTAADLDGIKFGLYTTYHLAQCVHIGKFPRRMVGTTQAMMSAADSSWPASMPKNSLTAGFYGRAGARVLRTHVGGGSNAVSWLFGVPLDGRRAPLYVRRCLLLDELRTRLVPSQECYQPGGFPEAAFRNWSNRRAETKLAG